MPRPSFEHILEDLLRLRHKQESGSAASLALLLQQSRGRESTQGGPPHCPSSPSLSAAPFNSGSIIAAEASQGGFCLTLDPEPLTFAPFVLRTHHWNLHACTL